MTRHGKNQTASACYSYHEKKKDSKTSGYGSTKVRLGKDSLQEFDCCSLRLQPCRDPVITPDGHLYDKEAILECLLHQKRENARKMKEYEKQLKKDEAELEELAKAEARDKMDKFLSTEGSITTKPVDPFVKETDKAATSTGVSLSTSSSASSSSSTSKPAGEPQKKKLPSFWVPSLTPDAKPTTVKKPEMKTLCPMSGKQLRVKDLIPVKFTPVADRDNKTSTIAKQARYMCAVTHDLLGNSIPCAVLRTTGDVVTMECVDKLIRKDMICPISGKQLKDSDIIQLVRGGTGYVGAGVKLTAEKKGAVMMT